MQEHLCSCGETEGLYKSLSEHAGITTVGSYYDVIPKFHVEHLGGFCDAFCHRYIFLTSCWIPRKHIIAMQGPFVKALNVALMEQFDISYMVTKDSGKEGGFDDKMEAAKEAGAVLVVIKRPDDEGVSAEDILREFNAC